MKDREWTPLVDELRAGRVAAWNVACAELRPRVVAYVERLGADRHGAEDVAQDVLGTVYGKLDKLKRSRRFLSWVMAIARNRLRSRVRGWRPTEELNDEVVIPTAGGQDRIFDDELRRVVMREVRQLAEPARRMVELRLFEDFAPHEISRQMGLPCAIVRRRSHDALCTLRQRLARRIGRGPEPF